jgi:16S rRNA processing protein RimM
MAVPGGIKAGKISKPYGLQGEVHIILIPVAAKYIEPGNPLFIDLDGQRVPFFIQSAELVSDDQAIVELEFIDSLELAKKVSGCDVYLDPKHAPAIEGEEEEFRRVVGYQAYDLRLGDLGIVSEYLPSEMNPVWLIDYQGKELMVPATHGLIQKIDHRKQTLHLDLPEGITKL